MGFYLSFLSLQILVEIDGKGHTQHIQVKAIFHVCLDQQLLHAIEMYMPHEYMA